MANTSRKQVDNRDFKSRILDCRGAVTLAIEGLLSGEDDNSERSGKQPVPGRTRTSGAYEEIDIAEMAAGKVSEASAAK